MADDDLTPAHGADLKAITRFLAKVDRSGECWLWTGARDKDGYGVAAISARTGRANRVAWTLFVGPIPEGLCVLHACDNPPCVRPGMGHLFLGTHADNAADRDAKGRQASGDRNGARVHIERMPRGDRHGSKTHPERVPRGARSGARTHPERRPRGASHWTALRPDRIARGVVAKKSTLVDDDIRYIRMSHEGGHSLAARFNVSETTISRIRRRKSWAHVDWPTHGIT